MRGASGHIREERAQGKEQQRTIAAGFLFAFLGACCWSFGGFFVRSTENIDAWQIVFYRSCILLVIMTSAMVWRHRSSFFQAFWEAGINAPIAGVALGLAGLTFILSLFYTTVAQAIFMAGISPFFTAMLGWWILGEKVSAPTWAAMTIALAGLVVMVWGSTGGNLIGAILALNSAFCFSCYSVLLRWGHKTDMRASVVWNALFLIFVSAAILAIPSPLRESSGGHAFAVGWWNVLVVFAMGAVQLALGLALFTKGSKTTPAAELALLSLAEPMLSPIWVWLAFGEVPPITTLAGGGLILAALAFRIVAMGRGPKYSDRLSSLPPA